MKKDKHEFSCDLCDFKTKTEGILKIYKGRKHRDIPQLDGASATPRQTYAWWEKNVRHVVRTYETYMNILADIEKSTLNKKEKADERERATNTRKDIFGGIPNCKYYPPWNQLSTLPGGI